METTFGAASSLARALLESAGMPSPPAARTAWALAVAEVWGRGSHGLLRLPFYLERFAAGGANPAAGLREASSTSVTAVYDGENGLGHWQLWSAAHRASAMAREQGIAAVAVGNSGHCGVLGLHVWPIVASGLVGLVFSSGPAVIPPWGGHAPVVSTSPLAAGIPTRPRPAIVDLAVSAVARGRIAEHAQAGQELPEGWAFDATGAPTTDPHAALAGMLAPLGGAKGFALAFLVEALAGGLVGPSLATGVADPLDPGSAALPQRIGHLVLALDPRRLDLDGGADDRLEALAASVLAAGGRLPGGNHRPPAEIGDDEPLEVADPVAARLAALARAQGVPLEGAWVRSGR